MRCCSYGIKCGGACGAAGAAYDGLRAPPGPDAEVGAECSPSRDDLHTYIQNVMGNKSKYIHTHI